MKEELRPGHGAHITKSQELLRIGLDYATLPVLRREIINKENLKKADDMINSGRGIVIIANHFSKREPVEFFSVAFASKTMRKTKIVYPVALHQKTPINPVGRILGAEPYYVVTDQSIESAEKKWLKNPSRNITIPKATAGVPEFTQAAINNMREGGITIMFPQGTRESQLYPPITNPAMLNIFLNAKRKHIPFGVLVVGIDAAGITDYNKSKKFNIGKKYTYSIGETYTDEEFIEKAGGIRNVDQFALSEIEKLVSPLYAGKGKTTRDEVL